MICLCLRVYHTLVRKWRHVPVVTITGHAKEMTVMLNFRDRHGWYSLENAAVIPSPSIWDLTREHREK